MARLHLVVGGKYLTIETNSPEVEGYFRESYSALIRPRTDKSVGILSITKNEANVSIRGVHELVTRGTHLDELSPHLDDEVIDAFTRANVSGLWLHAGAVERNGHAIAIVGPSGAGKSTFVAKLIALGWEHCADDALFVDPESQALIGIPVGPRPRRSGGHPAAGFENLPKTRIPIKPRMSDNNVSLRWLVFPEFTEVSGTVFQSLSSGESLLKLLQCVRGPTIPRTIMIERAMNLVKGVECFEAKYSYVDDILPHLARLNG